MQYEIDRKFIKAEGYLIPLEQINGITWNKCSKEWIVNIEYKKDTTKYLGCFKTLEMAIKNYLKFCKKYKTTKVKRYLIQGKLF